MNKKKLIVIGILLITLGVSCSPKMSPESSANNNNNENTQQSVNNTNPSAGDVIDTKQQTETVAPMSR